MKTKLLIMLLLTVSLLSACEKKTVIYISSSRSESDLMEDLVPSEPIVFGDSSELSSVDTVNIDKEVFEDISEANKKNDVRFSDEAEKLAEDLLNKEKQAFYSEEHEYEMDVEIYDKTVLQTPNGEFYYFRVSTNPLEEGDNAYIIKDSEKGAEVVFSFAAWSRNRYNIYDGGYIQNCGSGGAVCMTESLYRIDSEEKLIYTYKTDILNDYLVCSYNQDFGSSCNLVEKLKDAGVPENDYLDYLVVEMFSAGDSWIWKLDFPKRDSNDYKNIVLETIKSSDISDLITICSDDGSFWDMCNEILEEKKIDLDTIYQNKPIRGQRESMIWKIHN
ncbi:MAG: hypothetical protein K6G72_13620 [Lachnospiraceae bacterium]|nr:hypothetical protein [Lachnospiraceae bacterium]